MPATVPAEINAAALAGAPTPPGLSADEKHAYEQLAYFYKHGLGYANEMANRPQTLYGIGDSPVGLAAWMLDHDARSLALITRVFDGQAEGLTRDDVLDNITLYWLTNTAISSRPSLLGEQAPVLRPEERPDSGGGERVSRGALPGSAELDGEGISQARLLQPPRQGRALRGVGAAGAPGVRAACFVPIASLERGGYAVAIPGLRHRRCPRLRTFSCPPAPRFRRFTGVCSVRIDGGPFEAGTEEDAPCRTESRTNVFSGESSSSWMRNTRFILRATWIATRGRGSTRFASSWISAGISFASVARCVSSDGIPTRQP
jgi:hypothetical protein